MLKKNSININLKDLSAWFAVTGFTLPRNESELKRFNKLYANFEFKLKGDELDPDKIFDVVEQVTTPDIQKKEDVVFEALRTAARSFNDLPENIKAKMIANQKNAQSDSH